MTIRSALYVPGDQQSKLAKAFDRGADAVIVDLEDAVLPAAKGEARAAVADWLAALEEPAGQVWVRVNPGAEMITDLAALGTSRHVTGFVLAKADGPGQVAKAAALLDDLRSPAGLSPLLETAGAVLAAGAIAQVPRVRYLQLGEVDLCADVGITPGEDEIELLAIRTAIVLASAAAGREPPLAPVSTDYRDLDRFRRSTLALQRLGFVGRACIHPAQVTVANEVFTPSPAEVQTARELVARFAESAGGVTTDAQGRMIDRAVVRRAEQLLARVR